ncbi:hypothetical protein H6P81_011035 [Aristolochia fimbriata]|uniref:Uncharacterized protein n=1 Tax=Aristolochia fimbriata TaxID=158543 RepID=A0AAV7EQF1_ARIFI|nr:hypothetical protein H6P81_011035 [Aristolochia fimbriata]
MYYLRAGMEGEEGEAKRKKESQKSEAVSETGFYSQRLGGTASASEIPNGPGSFNVDRPSRIRRPGTGRRWIGRLTLSYPDRRIGAAFGGGEDPVAGSEIRQHVLGVRRRSVACSARVSENFDNITVDTRMLQV